MEKELKMSTGGYKQLASKRSVLKKDSDSSVGKENDHLPTRKARVTRLYSIPCGENRGFDENVPKRRVSLSQVEFKREESRSSLAVVDVSKTPFHVHCDEKDQEPKESCSDSNRTKAPKTATSQRINKPYESKIPVRKPVRSQSAKPTRASAPALKELRSNSEEVSNTKARSSKLTEAPKTSQVLPSRLTATRKTSNLPSKAVSKQVQVTSAKCAKPGGSFTKPLSTLRLRTGREYVCKRQVSVTHEVRKNEVTNNSKEPADKRIPEEKSEKIFFPKREQHSGVTETTANSQPVAANLEMKSSRRNNFEPERIPCISGSIVTPLDGPPPAPLMPVKELIKRAKHTAIPKKLPENQGTIAGFSYPAELAYHLEYINDLPVVEKETEDRAPQLSEHFLRRHINAHQRKEIVAYLIHLGVHCRYPSFAIYQTVKLFDVAMDRLVVRTERMQLVALAALWICLKRLEVYRKIPSATTILALANEMYVDQEELLMVYERKIVQAVDFNITFADTFALLSYYILKCKLQDNISEETTDLLYTYGGYMIDLTMLDERFCQPPANLVAFIVFELAMVLVQDSLEAAQALKKDWQYNTIATDYFQSNSSESSSTREKREVSALRAAIVRGIRDSGKKRSGYEVVYKKYNRSRYGSIARSLVERAKRLPSLDCTEY